MERSKLNSAVDRVRTFRLWVTPYLITNYLHTPIKQLLAVSHQFQNQPIRPTAQWLVGRASVNGWQEPIQPGLYAELSAQRIYQDLVAIIELKLRISVGIHRCSSEATDKKV